MRKTNKLTFMVIAEELEKLSKEVRSFTLSEKVYLTARPSILIAKILGIVNEIFKLEAEPEMKLKTVKLSDIKESAFEFKVGYKPFERDLGFGEYAKYGYEKGQIDLLKKLGLKLIDKIEKCDHCNKKKVGLKVDSVGWCLCEKCFPLYHSGITKIKTQ